MDDFKIHEPKRREVQRQHKWRHGHDPSDDEATPESGWEFATIKPPESSAHVEEEPGGGPDTGIRCQRCNSTYRAVASCTVGEALKAKGADVSRARPEYLAQRIVRLLCPCGHEMSLREDVLRGLMAGRS